MPNLIMPTAANERGVGKMPPVRLVNMMPERGAGQDGVTLIQRPALSAFAAVTGGNGVRGLHPFGEGIVATHTAGADLVGDDGAVSFVGALAGSDRTRAAPGASGLMICADQRLWWLEGLTISPVSFPDGAQVQDVAYLGGFFLASRRGTSAIYWSDALEPLTWNALSFVSAESADDPVVALMATSDELWSFGATTTQVFYLSGDGEAVIAPYQGRTFSRGCAARDTVVSLDNTLFWVGDDLNVYRAEGVPVVISEPWVSERLRRCVGQSGNAGDLSAWTYLLDGHAVYVLCCGPNEPAMAYDASTQVWSLFEVWSGGWRCPVGAQVGALCVAGDALTQSVFRLDPNGSSDALETVMQRRAPFFMPIGGGRVQCAVVRLWASAGWGSLSGQGLDPQAWLRWSDDQGQTWTDWVWRSSGRAGEYALDLQWRRLGQARYPGRWFEVMMTDPVPWRISGATVNEQ